MTYIVSQRAGQPAKYPISLYFDLANGCHELSMIVTCMHRLTAHALRDPPSTAFSLDPESISIDVGDVDSPPALGEDSDP